MRLSKSLATRFWCRAILTTSCLERIQNLEWDIPLIPWRGEIAVLFVRKRKFGAHSSPSFMSLSHSELYLILGIRAHLVLCADIWGYV
jgi:hypothetical protein